MASNPPPLQRTMRRRHVNLIAIGGAIGTGLFVATGASISTAGPGGAVLSYAVIGLAIYFVMNALGEMATHLPVPGAFQTYSEKYVDPAFGFMMGWTYWYACAMTIAVELVATSIVMKFWFPDSSSVMWSALALAILVGLNLFSAKVFGESEFWFASIKVVTIIIFLIVGVAMIFGIMGGQATGFSNWTRGEAPFVGGVLGTFSILMVAGFSFIGTESAAVAAGEVEDPKHSMPKAINSVFWRILLFYIGSRLLYSLAHHGQAPKAFGKVTRHGVPVAGVLFTALISSVAFLTSQVGDSIVYTWLYNATGLTGLITWLGTCVAHLRFRAAMKAQGVSPSTLPYRAKLFPFGTIYALIVCATVIIGQGVLVVTNGAFSVQGLLVAYIGLPLAIGLYLIFKLVNKTKVVPLTTMDLAGADV